MLRPQVHSPYSSSCGCLYCLYLRPALMHHTRDPTLDRAAVKRAVPESSCLPHLTWEVDAMKLGSQPLVPAWSRLQLCLAEHLATDFSSWLGFRPAPHYGFMPQAEPSSHRQPCALLEVPGCTPGTAPACRAAAPGQPSLQSCSLLLLPGSLFAGSTITFFLPESQKSQWMY